MSASQGTLGGSFERTGRALHSGVESRVVVHPAPADSGITFRRTDLPEAPEIRAAPDRVVGVEWETALAEGDARVRTVEHLLAALFGAGVDNALIELAAEEPPALDGSAAPWLEDIARVGVESLETPARVCAPTRVQRFEIEASRYTVLPHPHTRVTATIDFDHPRIGRQAYRLDVDPAAFAREIAPARTFGFTSWGERLQAEGYALGVTAENTILLSDTDFDGDVELRFDDEFVRHKILDIVGDLALVGARLQCHVIADRPSHRGNAELARRLAAQTEKGRNRGMEIQEIMQLLPHRYPMLLVDRVLDLEEGERIVGLKNVTANEPFFQGHFPDHPIMPGVLIVEALAQCGGILMMKGMENPEEKVIYFVSIDDVKFRRPVVPGDQLTLEIEVVRFRGTRAKLKGIARVEGQVATEATILGQVVDK